MKTPTVLPTKDFERKLIEVVRRLPLPRVAEVIDFAQFLEFQITRTDLEELSADYETEEEIQVDNARWDELLATEESQGLLESMADAAWTEIEAGNSRPMIFTDDGDIVSG